MKARVSNIKHAEDLAQRLFALDVFVLRLISQDTGRMQGGGTVKDEFKHRNPEAVECAPMCSWK